MANFPALSTGAVAQYPLDRSVRFSTETVRFMDGSQQKYRLYARALRRWAVKLNLLNEQELNALVSFVDAQGGAPFTFTDPLTSASVPNCVVAGQQSAATLLGESNGEASLTIVEVL